MPQTYRNSVRQAQKKATKRPSAKGLTLLAQASPRHRRALGAVFVVAMVGVGYLAVHFGLADSCTVSSNLVNSCRPLYGTAMATITPYSQAASDQVSQMKYQDQRIGHKSDIAHLFNSPGNNTIPAAGTALINDGYTLMLNWKPASPWVNGYNGSSNTAIDSMAVSLKSVAPHKVMLVIWHEPENDVTPGGADCSVSKGSSGSASDYVKMWQYTVTRLRADGVTNAVYTEYFQNYPPLTCNNINQLYAGDNYVDWIGFDDYAQYGSFASSSWNTVVGRFYNYLTTNSNSAHDYLSKPWLISEIGVANFSEADEENWYQQAATAITKDTFPNIKAFVDFDDNNPSTGTAENRQAYDDAGTFMQSKQDAYNTFVNAIYNKVPLSTPKPTPISSPVPIPKPTTTPTPKLSSGSVTLVPSSDTYVNVNRPTSNFGAASPLVATLHQFRAFLRLKTSAVVPVGYRAVSAQLQLYVTYDAVSTGGFEVHPEISSGWAANMATWNNQPAWNSNVVVTSVTPKTGQWLTVNVPLSAVNLVGDTTYGISYTVANSGASFASREDAAHAPRLIIKYVH